MFSLLDNKNGGSGIGMPFVHKDNPTALAGVVREAVNVGRMTARDVKERKVRSIEGEERNCGQLLVCFWCVFGQFWFIFGHF